jgi:hypothetical protein
MATSAFIGAGNVAFSVATVASPASFDAMPEVISISGLGATNELVDATHFDSTAREYIAGLADGSEVTVECNYIQNNAIQERVIADVASRNTVNCQCVYDFGSPETTFSFAAVALGWQISPSVDDRQTISFTFKISGSITVA